MTNEKATIRCEAIFSDDKEYRYLLSKVWDKNRPIATVISISPSTFYISGFLSASNPKNLEYIINPLFGYTPYGQEDFDEICDYLRYCGERPKEEFTFKQTLPQYADFFSLVHTAVGDYVVCYDTEKNIQGILNRK